MELKQAAQDLKDLRNLRDMAQKKPGITRYVIWGSVAVCTVFAAALSIAVAVSATRNTKPPAQIVAKPSPAATSATAPATTASIPALPPVPTKSQTELEISKLQDALRALAAERDRLVNRVDQLERSVGDITASIAKEKEKPSTPAPRASNDAAIQPSSGGPQARQSPAMPPARPDNAPNQMAMQQPAQSMQIQRAQQRPMMDDDDGPPPSQARGGPNTPGTFNQTTMNARQVQPPPVPPAPIGTNRLQNPNQQAMAPNQGTTQPSDSTASRTEFAIDLGGEASIDGLRALWANIRGNHGVALEGLRPLVSVRDGVKQGTVELRLVAGPLANAGAAARACAMLHAKGVPCQTTIFDGQRLALR